jgi:hypothetical protein
MNKLFKDASNDFRSLCKNIECQSLSHFQQVLLDERDGPSYKLETSVVYNSAIDKIENCNDIKLILVADNPGRREQAAENRSYLVGPSGKIAEGFFKKEMSIDFRKNIIILNKTPIHTPRTAELKKLCSIGGDKISNLVEHSQKEMANLVLKFYKAIKVPIWIIGYSEMKKKGIFETYTKELALLLNKNLIDKNSLFLFRHFSMNQFTADLRKQRKQLETTEDALARIGASYRERIFGAFNNILTTEQ